MIKEIYNRMPSDPGYSPILETQNKYDIILQHVKMLLGTRPGQILGSPDFGIMLEDMLFTYGANNKLINDSVNDYLRTYIPTNTGFNVSAEVNYGKDVQNRTDYAVIDIKINGNKLLGLLVTG